MEEEEVIDEDNVYIEEEEVQKSEITLDHNDDLQQSIIEDETNIIDMLDIKDEKNTDAMDNYISEEQLIDDEDHDDGEDTQELSDELLLDDCSTVADDDEEGITNQYDDTENIQNDGVRILEGDPIYDEEHLDDQQVSVCFPLWTKMSIKINVDETFSTGFHFYRRCCNRNNS